MTMTRAGARALLAAGRPRHVAVPDGGQALSSIASACRPRGLSLTMGDDEVTELLAALRPRLAGSVALSARPVPAPPLLRRLEPLAAVFLGLHGVMVLTGLGGKPWQRGGSRPGRSCWKGAPTGRVAASENRRDRLSTPPLQSVR